MDRGEADERAALEAARRGETGDLGRLLASYTPRLQRMVAFRMDPRLRSRFEPVDVVQEGFAEAVARVDDALEHRDSLFLWVRFLVGQRLSQLHRAHLGTDRRDARLEVPLTVRGTPGASSFCLASALIDRGATPSRAVLVDEQRERLRIALEGMKDIDREVILLRHFEHLTNAEVAELLELTPPGASLRYMRALERLQEIASEHSLSLSALRRE